MLLIAIMTPLTVTRMIDQIEAPSDTAASSSALVWPTVANWPISMGQDRRHNAAASRRIDDRVKEWGIGERGGKLM